MAQVRLNLSDLKRTPIVGAPEIKEVENGEQIEGSGATGTPNGAAQGVGGPDHGLEHSDTRQLAPGDGEANSAGRSAHQVGPASVDQNESAASVNVDSDLDTTGAGDAGGVLGDSSGGDAALEPVGQPVKPAPGLLKGLRLGGPKPTIPAKPAALHPPVASSVEGPADSLKALATSESAGVPTIASMVPYEDEIPATAPERELPEEMTEGMTKFVESLDTIYRVLSDPELMSQAIRNIMMELQNNKQYIKLIADDDVAVMIRGMRESMGLARIRKEEGKAKRAGGSAAGRKANPKNDDMMDSLLAIAGGTGMKFD